MNGTVYQGTNRAPGRRSDAARARRTQPRDYGVAGNTALKLAVLEAEHLDELAEPALAPVPAMRRRPRLRVAPPLPVAVPRAPFVITLLVIVVVGVLGVLMINTKINENSFRLGDLQDQQSGLDQQEQQLAQRLAGFESATGLAAAAKRLGLVPAGTPAFIQLPNGVTLGVPTPATGAPSVTASGADGPVDGQAGGNQGSAG